MNKIVYWVATGFVCLMMVFSASMYIFNNAAIQEAFTGLGYPTFIIYPLAVAKLLAVVAILTRRSSKLKEWAYAGLFFDFLLALQAHLVAQDGQFVLAAVALVALIVSYIYDEKVFSPTEAVTA